MAKINVPITSVQDITPIGGKYWFMAVFTDSAGNLISDSKFPQNQSVSTTNTTLPNNIEVTVGDGVYTIPNIFLKLYLGDSELKSIPLQGTVINCQGPCIQPTYSNYVVNDPICNEGVTDNIGTLVINGLANYNRYKLFEGTPTAGYDTATPSSSTNLSVPVPFPANSGQTRNYTLRLYNGREECRRDISFTVNFVPCEGSCCSLEIDEIIVDGTPPIECDLVQTSNPQFQIAGSNKQIKVFLYSAVPNLAPFTYRIYNSSNNLVQTITNVTNPDTWINIDNNLPNGSYTVEVTDKRPCTTARRPFEIIGDQPDEGDLWGSVYITA